MDRKDTLKVQGKEVKFVIDMGKNQAFELVLIADGYAFYMNPGDEVFVMDLNTGGFLEKEEGKKWYHKTMKEVVNENKAYEFIEISFLLDKAGDFSEKKGEMVKIDDYSENCDPEDEWDRAMIETIEWTKQCEAVFRAACRDMVESMHSPDRMGEMAYEEWEKFEHVKYDYRIEDRVQINKNADETLKQILSKNFNNFGQYEEVGKITNLEVAKVIIKRLLEEIA